VSPPVLTAEELTAMVRRVFQPREADRALAVLVDLPDREVPDNERWRTRRELAVDWSGALASARAEHGLDVGLFWYRNARSNNADLPEGAWRQRGARVPDTADELDEDDKEPLREVLSVHTLVLAPTQFSATAPLKMLSRELGFRAATMPGFAPAMVPALRLDYAEIGRRVRLLKALLDLAAFADLAFTVDGSGPRPLRLDLRHRTAHASGGLLPDPGTAGNLPSGEAYIVPYEGERPGDPSRSEGVLPVQLGGEVVEYRIEGNRVVEVVSEGPESQREAAHLFKEPAYGNMAELGLGVLGDFGIEPIGEVLLDEKLGLHIAFGRSDHFGGQVGPEDFSRPEAVVHQDRVYVPALQPRVSAARVDLRRADGRRLALMRDGRYVIDFEVEEAG
jgi:leucyl aminopeptidase (aminopeptidase T)